MYTQYCTLLYNLQLSLWSSRSLLSNQVNSLLACLPLITLGIDAITLMSVCMIPCMHRYLYCIYKKLHQESFDISIHEEVL